VFIRRIAASACALSLVIPAAALAVPIHDPVAPKQQPAVVAYGDTKYDLQNQQDLSAPIGDTKSDLKPTTAAVPSARTDVDRIASLSAEQLAAAYGTTRPAAPATASFATHDTTNGWQIAAWAEAAVLAAFVLGSAVVIGGRTRSRRLGS
jgi:hypothetical protein